MDVAHCRINLLYQGVDAAEAFVTRGWQTDTGCSFHRWAEIATIIGFLDAERRQPSPQRKRHDLETVVQRAVSEIGSPQPPAQNALLRGGQMVPMPAESVRLRIDI